MRNLLAQERPTRPWIDITLFVIGACRSGGAPAVLEPRKEITMQSRMKNPATIVPDALPALYALSGAIKKAGVPLRTLDLVNLRASQINGCGYCVDMHARDLKKAGESDARLFAVAAWRDTPYFTEAERAALALTEAATRISDQPDPVSDELWAEVSRHYDERALAALLLQIGMINLWNRTNVPTRQMVGPDPR
jgi:AhpD family alkylhydroperoxidase